MDLIDNQAQGCSYRQLWNELTTRVRGVAR